MQEYRHGPATGDRLLAPGGAAYGPGGGWSGAADGDVGGNAV